MVRRELLEMRLDALEEDITKVEQVIDAAKKRGNQLEQVRKKIGPTQIVNSPLLDVKATVSRLVDLIRFNPRLLEEVRRVGPTIPDDLATSLEKLDRAFTSILQANETLDEIKQTFVDLDALDINFEPALSQRCGDAKNKVDGLRGDLDKRPLREVWHDYEKLINEDCHVLFSEYVDFLGGLTLRDTALDDGVCSMTDRLLQLYVDVADQRSLAVPVHHSPVGDAMRNVIKLGFPEWTIWSIALVGHDIGRGIATRISNQRGFSPFLTEARSETHLRHLLADAFAAYSLGLAYGCATIILHLQPHHDDGDPDTPSDVERAGIILAVLRRLTSTGDPLDVSVERLAEHWQEAVEHLTDFKPVDPPWLTDFAATAVDGFKRLRVTAYGGTEFAYGLTRWAERLAAEPLSPQVGDTDATLQGIVAEPGETTSAEASTVVELLNTAWKLRLDEPSVVDTVSQNVQQLWRSAEPPAGAFDYHVEAARRSSAAMARRF